MRYFIEFSYLGTAYHGWQKQPNAISVQEVLEKAVSLMLRFSLQLVAAGRTDTGVHAKQMFAHFDFEGPLDPPVLMARLNSFLPGDIAVQRIRAVQAEAHARFDALQRTYEYWVVQKKDPFFKESAYLVLAPLDMAAMNKASEILLEYEDFECFSKTHSDVKTFICKILRANWHQDEDRLVFTITADRFLRNMVRAIVGTLLDIGKGKKQVNEIRHIVESKDRGRAGVSVPAKGLYLTRVIYPDSLFV